MVLTNRIKNQHLLWRAAFGPMAENVKELDHVSPANLYKILEETSSRIPEPIFAASGTFNGLVKGVQGLAKMEQLSKDQKAQRRRQSASDIKDLNLTWLSEMINSGAQLREKVSLFWHGHFACRVVNIYFQQQLLHVIRENALGNFGTLLKEVSKTPAMLSFLNNQQNKKQHPNENFAREVMELFTMGRGNYSEEDVKEAARAFTGWGFNLQGQFLERPYLHDNGSKTFLGRSGNFDGHDILDIILEQKSTATFITRKIYRFFVNDIPDEQRVAQLASRFHQSNYDLQELFRGIFTAGWFYDEKNIGTRIKSPVELIAGIRRLLPMELERPEIQLLFERALGQVLFYPPNVAGWPGGNNWIDSSALMLRLRIPQILTNAQRAVIKPKDDDDVMMGREAENQNLPGMPENLVNWSRVEEAFSSVPRADLLNAVISIVLQSKTSIPSTILNQYIDNSSRTNFIKTAIVQIMSTPEYQLC